MLRTTRRLLLVLILAAGTAAGGFLITSKQPAKSAAAAPVLKTTAVTSGDLTTTEKVDGTLEISSSLVVLHRIEGQVSSATANGAPAAATGAQGSSAAGLAAAVSSVRLAGLLIATVADLTAVATPCPDPADPTTTTTTTTLPTGASAPACTPGGDGESTTPSTIPSAAIPTTTMLTVPVGTDDAAGATTTTTSVGTDATSTTTAGSRGSGGTFGGGSGTVGSSSASGSTGSASSSSSSSARVTQTVTSVIRVGATVGLGDVLYTVDSQPVVALSGGLPAWRSLSTASTNGPDIAQLEISLVSLGYDPGHTVVIDDHFDSHTKAMVERWQTGLGIVATGKVLLGSVVFLPNAGPSGTTVSAVSTSIGSTVGDGDAIVTLTTDTQDVVIDVPDGDEAFIVPGLSVQLGTGTGTVSLLRSIDRSGTVVVEAVIVPTAPIDGASNGATVKVTITTDSVPGVLIVPAEALLSRLDGSYAVQVQATHGTVTWHTVELLGISGNKVAIRGDGVAAGTLVLVPV
ncbi:MAG: peptidoglycan-binding protein [Acidimicrobiales bacterium]|nr:peptidoglycan-binding protein [Acidimicrobiales bacterium]